jgi:hypothetical protein
MPAVHPTMGAPRTGVGLAVAAAAAAAAGGEGVRVLGERTGTAAVVRRVSAAAPMPGPERRGSMQNMSMGGLGGNNMGPGGPGGGGYSGGGGGDIEGDRKSEGQSSHGSSRMSLGRSTFAKLRRALADTKTKQRSAGLRRLWMVGYGLVIVNVALASVAASVLDASFASYSVNLRFAELASLSTAAMFRGLRLVSGSRSEGGGSCGMRADGRAV